MKTVREAKLKKAVLRLLEKDKAFIGIVISENKKIAQIEGTDADDVWRRLHDEAGKSGPLYFGYDGARNRFLHFFNSGFQSPNYLQRERRYKLEAKSKLDAAVPLESAVSGTGFGESVFAAYSGTNLLSPFEKMRVRDVLRSSSADNFIKAAARFTLEVSKASLLDMEQALKAHDCAKWTVVTYLPFLWRPLNHMFLKPEATKDFSERVGHRFYSDYEPRLHLPVYESLQSLATTTENEIADLKPRDRIDTQSFIWVVGDYKDDSEAPVI